MLHCFPATHQGISVGNHADITAFSFYANKTITTGEGGMLTSDSALAARSRLMRLYGDRDVFNRFQITTKAGVTMSLHQVINITYRYSIVHWQSSIV